MENSEREREEEEVKEWDENDCGLCEEKGELSEREGKRREDGYGCDGDVKEKDEG